MHYLIINNVWILFENILIRIFYVWTVCETKYVRCLVQTANSRQSRKWQRLAEFETQGIWATWATPWLGIVNVNECWHIYSPILSKNCKVMVKTATQVHHKHNKEKCILYIYMFQAKEPRSLLVLRWLMCRGTTDVLSKLLRCTTWHEVVFQVWNHSWTLHSVWSASPTCCLVRYFECFCNVHFMFTWFLRPKKG